MNCLVDDLIRLARRMIREDRPHEASACLRAVLKSDPVCLPAHNLLEENQLPGNFSDWTGVIARIHEADDIFRFFARHPTSLNPIRDYLADGWRTMSELMLLMDAVERSLCRGGRFLEFACGHGRFTRHLKRWLEPGSLHVSDVVPGAVDFLKETLGVHGFYSKTAPEEMVWPAKYDTVFVLSLFSHLPRQTWFAWLEQLWLATAVGGVLIFSVHGEVAAKQAGVELEKDGFTYFEGSESSVLEPSMYGCTYTGRAFVEEAIGRLSPRAKLSIFPGHFWATQDAVVLEK